MRRESSLMSPENGRKGIIVGIDPGTTTGCAIIDLSGRLILLFSKRDAGLSSVIARIAKEGRVVGVGCDKANPPSFVARVASNFNARLLSPEEDLPVSLKKELTSKYTTANDHERDALASALFSLARIKPHLERIKRGLRRRGMEELFNEAAILILKGYAANIPAALSVIRKRKEGEKNRPKPAEKSEDSLGGAPSHVKNKEAKLRRIIQEYEKRERFLRSALSSAKKSNSSLKKKYDILMKSLSARQTSGGSVGQIKHVLPESSTLKDELASIRRAYSDMNKKYQRLINIISHIERFVVAPFFDSLSSVSEKTILNLGEFSFVVIANFSPLPKEVRAAIHKMSIIIVSLFRDIKGEGLYKKKYGLNVIYIKDAEHFSSIAFIPLKSINSSVSADFMAESIINDYRSLRR